MAKVSDFNDGGVKCENTFSAVARGDNAFQLLVMRAANRWPVFGISPTFIVSGVGSVAAALLTDYAKLPPEQRNIPRLIFADSRVRAAPEDWLGVARFVVGAFRADVARAGATTEITNLVEELSLTSPEFDALWRDTNVAVHGEGLKRIRHPELGLLELEFSAFAVDGRPELGMVVYNPATDAVADLVRRYLEQRQLP
jgi:hypothetical protein